MAYIHTEHDFLCSIDGPFTHYKIYPYESTTECGVYLWFVLVVACPLV